LGKRLSVDEEINQRKDIVCRLFVNENKKWSEIQKILKLSRSLLFKIRNQLILDGKLIKDEKTGYASITGKPLSENNKQIFSKSDFIENHTSVKKLWSYYKYSSNPSGYITALQVVCNTLCVEPEMFLISFDESNNLFEKFVDKHRNKETVYHNKITKIQNHSGFEISHKRYSDSIRRYMLINNISIPPNNQGYLSGKKENFGIYSKVQLSDKEYTQLLDFMGNINDGHNLEWQVLVILSHDSFMRPNTAINYKFNLQNKKIILDGIECDYYTDDVYEKKQKKHFPKWIFRKESKDILDKIPENFTILKHLPISKKQKQFANHLRDFYISINKIERGQVYQKIIDNNKFYLSTRPINTLRHSGAHYTMRSCGYNANTVGMFGWDDESIISKVYASTTPDKLLIDGSCEYCDPPKHIDNSEDKIFCKLSHAIIFNSNNGMIKGEVYCR